MRLRPLVAEAAIRELEVRTGEGLDARRSVDLSTLEADALVLPAERFYLRTGVPLDRPEPEVYAIRLTGCVAEEREVLLDEILPLVRPMGVLHWECSGNGEGSRFGLMSAGDFAGVPLAEVLALASALPEATAVRISGHDEHPASEGSDPGASWVFRPDELAEAWLVTHEDGEPVPLDHGHPVRLVVPGWYGCCNLKWVEEIAWVGDDEPATPQMQEFASRTHQDGVPALARDYAPAEIGVSALVVRVEEWDVDGDRVLVAVGVVWGGKREPAALRLWMDSQDLGPVEVCRRDSPATWGLWSMALPPGASGEVVLRCEIDDAELAAPRLEDRYYDRVFDLG